MNGKQLTLIASLEDMLGSSPVMDPGYCVRTVTVDDKEILAELYLATYPVEIVKDLAEARDEIKLTFQGEYGPLDLDASPIVWKAGQAAASVLTVTEAPWHDTPPGPFIIEVMVHPAHRRKGLAAYLMQDTSRRLKARGEKTVALRVMSDNPGALHLYNQLGFHKWTGGQPAT
jgi:ribosomal protein S18 acetylase RimI-like enzyme